MKGSSIFTATNVLLFIISAALGTVMLGIQVSSYYNLQATVENRENASKMIDLGEALLSDTCLLNEKHVFDPTKLNTGPCVEIPSYYSASVKDINENSYLSELTQTSQVELQGDELSSITFPCTITSGDKIISCILIIQTNA